MQAHTTFDNSKIDLDTQLLSLKSLAGEDRFSGELPCQKAGERLIAMLPAHRIGETIGAYELQSRLGEGGMGTVYLGRHTTLNQPAAVKVLHSNRREITKNADRFQNEIAAIGQLVHPNIVRALHAGEDKAELFLAMEYVDGIDLGSLLATHGSMTVPIVAEIGLQAARGLQHAHDMGFVHRDVKPSNLMLSESGQIKLLDLGLAKHLARCGNGLTGEGQTVGTTDFMAPEQLGSAATVDQRADIYGLGATLYYLLSSMAPFDHRRFRDSTQQISAILSESPLPMQHARAGNDGRLDQLIDRMINRDGNRRPQSMAEVIEALQPFASGEASLSKLFGAGENLPPLTQPERVFPSTNSPRISLHSIGTLTVTVVVMMLAVLAIAGGDATHEESTKPNNKQHEPMVTRARRSKSVARDVFRLGGTLHHGTIDKPIRVTSTKELPEKSFRIVAIDLSGVEQATSTAMAKLGPLPDLGGLVLENTGVDDSLRDMLPYYPKLRALYLGKTRVTNALLPHLADRKSLRGIGLGGSNIGDENIASLAKNPHLEKLVLSDTRVTDVAIERLAGMPMLNHLDVAGTSVTDESIARFASFPSLRHLDIRRTQITADGAARLRKQMPKCDVLSSPE